MLTATMANSINICDVKLETWVRGEPQKVDLWMGTIVLPFWAFRQTVGGSQIL